MDSWIVPITIAIALGIGFMTAGKRQRRKNESLNPTIIEYLSNRDMTLPDLAQEMGMSSLVARGKVAMALGELVSKGKISTIPPPPGTPQTKKIHSIRYKLERA